MSFFRSASASMKGAIVGMSVCVGYIMWSWQRATGHKELQVLLSEAKNVKAAHKSFIQSQLNCLLLMMMLL